MYLSYTSFRRTVSKRVRGKSFFLLHIPLLHCLFYPLLGSEEPAHLITQPPSSANFNDPPKCPEITGKPVLAMRSLCEPALPQLPIAHKDKLFILEWWKLVLSPPNNTSWRPSSPSQSPPQAGREGIRFTLVPSLCYPALVGGFFCFRLPLLFACSFSQLRPDLLGSLASFPHYKVKCSAPLFLQWILRVEGLLPHVTRWMRTWHTVAILKLPALAPQY